MTAPDDLSPLKEKSFANAVIKLEGFLAQLFQELRLAGFTKLRERVEPGSTCAAVETPNQPTCGELRNHISADVERQSRPAAELLGRERLVDTAEDSSSSVCLG